MKNSNSCPARLSIWNFSPYWPSKCPSRLQQMTFINIFSLFFRENKTWWFKWIPARQRIHIKNQALFSSKSKSKKLKCRLLQFLLSAFRVNHMCKWTVRTIELPMASALSLAAASVLAKLQQTTLLFFLLLSFKENKAWCFMWILCLAEDSHEISILIFSEKCWKNIQDCHLLSSWLAP